GSEQPCASSSLGYGREAYGSASLPCPPRSSSQIQDSVRAAAPGVAAPRKGVATTMTIAESPANSGVIERGPESATISSASPALSNGRGTTASSTDREQPRLTARVG